MILEARKIDLDSIENEIANETKGSLRIGFFTGLLNPKAIIFYMAFLAQFINPVDDQFSQFAILMLTSSLVVAIVLGGYAILASQVCKTFQSVQARRGMGFASGGLLLGGSMLLAETR